LSNNKLKDFDSEFVLIDDIEPDAMMLMIMIFPPLAKYKLLNKSQYILKSYIHLTNIYGDYGFV